MRDKGEQPDLGSLAALLAGQLDMADPSLGNPSLTRRRRRKRGKSLDRLGMT